jgi:16S rRNA processing protein RimM
VAARPERGRDKRVCVAQIGAAHGLKGEMRLRAFTATPDGFAQYGPLETEDRSRRLEIESLRTAGRDFIVRFRGITDRSGAEALRNVNLYIAREILPAASEDEFYHADLIGLVAVTPAGEPFGDVTGIHNFGAGDIIELRLAATGETLMLPFDARNVPVVDIVGGCIVVDPPADAED